MRYVAYYRVSTARQGMSGLGLLAQQDIVRRFTGNDEFLLQEFTEIESGRKKDRPELSAALTYCKKHRCVLVIAKLDRLARNAAFLLSLRDAGVEFVACDIPHANRMVIGIMAIVAEEEAHLISERTKAALARCTKKLGNPKWEQSINLARQKHIDDANAFAASILPILSEIRQAGILSLQGAAKALNARGIMSRRGGRWTATSVRNVIQR